MASKMFGVRQYRAALKRLPGDLRDEVAGSITETVRNVHTRGKANIEAMGIGTTPPGKVFKDGQPRGQLRRLYRRSVSKKSLVGRVGYLSSRSRALAFYVRFVHDGTVKLQARPFHRNAVEAERELDTQRMVRARDDALRKATARR